MTKYLRKRGTDDLYVYTDILAARSDMIPVDELPAPVPLPTQPETGAVDPQPTNTPPSLRWTKDQLLAYAESLGMVLDESLSKAEIMALIEPDHAGK